jgi:putative transposase
MNHDLLHGNPGTTFSNILERDDYDSTRHAVVLLSTFREILHKWIIDVYLQTPHRGIHDIPSHRWRSETIGLPPPLPPSAAELDIVLGMTAQRVVFHYGIELGGLRYNSQDLGELRRRIGASFKVELTFNPGDLGQINVLDPQKGIYIVVPAVDQAYAKGLSLWQNKVIRRYAQRQLSARTDTVALAQAKAEIRALVERDFNRRSTRGRKRYARFMEDHSDGSVSELVGVALVGEPNADCQVTQAHRTDVGAEWQSSPAQASAMPDPTPSPSELFTDDATLPVFEAGSDLPQLAVAATSEARDGSSSSVEETQ